MIIRDVIMNCIGHIRICHLLFNRSHFQHGVRADLRSHTYKCCRRNVHLAIENASSSLFCIVIRIYDAYGRRAKHAGVWNRRRL